MPTPFCMRATRAPAETDEAGLNDELLAVRCQLGEHGALDALVDRWHTRLWQYVRRMSGDDESAAETVQDIWLRVLRSIPQLRDPSRLRPWLFGIARRAVSDRLRAAYAEPLESDLGPDDIPASDDAIDLEQTIGVVHEALAALPVGPREVLVLFYLHELSLQQLAEVLCIPVGTVKSRLFSARARLRNELINKGWQS